MPTKRGGNNSASNGKSANGTASTRCLATINLALLGICPVAPNRNANSAWAQHFIHRSRTLASLRDALLPKPLNGELSVAELLN